MQLLLIGLLDCLVLLDQRWCDGEHDPGDGGERLHQVRGPQERRSGTYGNVLKRDVQVYFMEALKRDAQILQ